MPFFSSQCNFPIIVGALLYIASGIEVYTRLLMLTLYCIGVLVPLILALIISNKANRLLASLHKIARVTIILEKISGLAMIIGGILILLS